MSRTYADFCEQFVREAPAATKQGERVFLQSAALAQFTTAEQKNSYVRGLPLGFERHRGFEPTLALLRVLGERSEVFVTVPDSRSQWLFLCGRDLFPGTFTTTRGSGFVLVKNDRGETLGLGELKASDRGLSVRAVMDLGNYLRHDTVSLEGKTPRRKVGRNGKPLQR